MLSIDPATLLYLCRSAEWEGDPIVEDLEDKVPRALYRLSADELAARAESGVSGSGLPAVTRESGVFLSETDVSFAVDTVRRVSSSGVSPAESVDLDRIISLLLALKG